MLLHRGSIVLGLLRQPVISLIAPEIAMTGPPAGNHGADGGVIDFYFPGQRPGSTSKARGRHHGTLPPPLPPPPPAWAALCGVHGHPSLRFSPAAGATVGQVIRRTVWPSQKCQAARHRRRQRELRNRCAAQKEGIRPRPFAGSDASPRAAGSHIHTGLPACPSG
ncbi:hypothetical protein CDD83_5467 [Cordyceps sp. RAO-2017]|nr:hypothetical protein CDD83_5467 [Cordyceps sp. RAO-2017]